MDAGKDLAASSSVAAVAAARQVAATDVIGLLTPKGGLSATDITRSNATRPPATDHASPPVSPTVAELSPGAQLLLKLLGAVTSQTPPLQAAQALLSKPPVEPGTSAAAAIAQALQTGLEHSGLFYESHLADWVAGQRSLAAIHAEPQTALQTSWEADVAAASSTGTTAHALPEATSSHTPGPPLNTIVSAQLDVIDSGQLRWQGELWPGMPAELWLQREPRQNDADSQGPNTQPKPSDEADHHRWQARLVTTLPTLGKISTCFSLQGERLELQLNCAQPATANTLQTASAQLADSLNATGIQLQGFCSEVDDAAATA